MTNVPSSLVQCMLGQARRVTVRQQGWMVGVKCSGRTHCGDQGDRVFGNFTVTSTNRYMYMCQTHIIILCQGWEPYSSCRFWSDWGVYIYEGS